MSAKKQFFVTIPMMPPENVRELTYTFKGYPDRAGIKVTSRFPGIALLKENITEGDDFEIVVLWTDKPLRTNSNAEFTDSITNLNTFYDELSKLENEIGVSLKAHTKEIVIPYNEERSKQIESFKMICESFIKSADIYMDLTYGTKMSIIDEFASLIYAEKACGCYIRELVYGSFDFDEGNTAVIYDVRLLYEMNSLIQSASDIPGIDIKKILDMYKEE